ncbi:MAG: hypothetical protein IIB56_03205 [Planctomycetes bacterium]|nr:hypothetical protein [Planctomycetota bacterium]MCH8118116.1 hypothetical protein [Planctomycetota bacterium]
MNEKDTSPDAQRVLVDIYRKMPANIKIRRIFEAYQTGKILAMAGLRESHPQASEKQIWYLWAKQHLGEKLFNEVYGALPDE